MCLFRDHSVTIEPFTQSVWSTQNLVIPNDTVGKIITPSDSEAYFEDLTFSGLYHMAFWTSFWTAFTLWRNCAQISFHSVYSRLQFFATLHSKLSSWKRTLWETDESFSSSRTYYILWSRSVYYHFQKNNWTLTWRNEAIPHPSIPDTWDPSILGSP